MLRKRYHKFFFFFFLSFLGRVLFLALKDIQAINRHRLLSNFNEPEKILFQILMVGSNGGVPLQILKYDNSTIATFYL
jgi:hypothetical protein